MISKRSLVLLSLMALPAVIFAAVGGYAIWQNGSLNWVWWVMTGCIVLTGIVSVFWKPSRSTITTEHELPIDQHWTPRDEQAAEVVRRYQLAIEDHPPEQLVDPHFYLQQVQSLAVDLVQVYHPQASDPLEQLTVPEVMAAVRLAVDDLEQWLLESVPGSQMLTIRHWKMLPSVPGWLEKASQATWAASILLNPANIARYMLSKWSWQPITEQLQGEILAVAYLRFIRQTGYYLIEMNSGRLRGGAEEYRRTFDARQRGVTDVKLSSGETDNTPVTIALIGQVSSGKSSLINHLTGSDTAKTDILPETRTVQRFVCELGESTATVTLLDTPGYGESGASKDQLAEINSALQLADAALLVMDAHSPAREPDRQTLEQLKELAASQPQLKPAPVIGVLTHVDLLPPPLEWNPPYAWREPESRKAEQIKGAVDYTIELFGNDLKDVVPVCSDAREDRTWGIAEELLPCLLKQLDDVKAVAMLKAYESQLSQERFRIVLRQIRSASSQLLKTWIEERIDSQN